MLRRAGGGSILPDGDRGWVAAALELGADYPPKRSTPLALASFPNLMPQPRAELGLAECSSVRICAVTSSSRSPEGASFGVVRDPVARDCREPRRTERERSVTRLACHSSG